MWFIVVDDLFKEANIEPNGKVKYDEFIHKITIPVRDYWLKRMQESFPWVWKLWWIFKKKSVAFTLGRWQAQWQDDITQL